MEKRPIGRPPKPPEQWGREAQSAKEVRALRAKLGWSRDRLAAVLGVTFSTVFRWETGRQEPKREHLDRLRALAAGSEEQPRGEQAA